MKVSRRKFIGASAAAVIVAGTRAKGKVFGANDRIAAACMGIRGRGGSHIDAFMGSDKSEVVALCDVDQRVLEGRANQVEKKQGAKPKPFVDIRDLLADDSIDVLTIATPNHWHALAAIWACEANKDVYVEKPLSHSLWEGRQLMAAAKKHGRVVMHGTQQRSDSRRIRDMKLLHDGIIGDIVMARGTVYKNGNRYAIGHGQEAPPPAALDYNLWQGPARERAYMVKKEDPKTGLFVPYNWHWFWDYGNGEIGNQGVHEMDVACWAANKGLPVKAYSSGGRYAWDDDGETPNTQSTTFTYADGTMLEFEVRNLGSFPDTGHGSESNSAFGTDGYWTRSGGFFNYKGEPIEVTEEGPPSEGCFGNFLKAVETRKPEDNFAPPEAGRVGCAHIHIGNIAYRLGRSVNFDPQSEQFIGDDEANAMIKRDYRDPFVVKAIS
jgi:predicted dehydrogenase